MSAELFLPYVSRLPLSWVDLPGPVSHRVEGTLLFVDVAGFTALSERLSKTGRAGAEELTELLDRAFSQLLAAAYDDGGSLLSFGGDALLLFFEGPDHARRGAHAAAVIRRRPKDLGPLQSSVGPIRLRLSMGAHSGEFLFLVTGMDSRVVLVLGPDVTATVRLEQRATGGEIMLGPSLALAVPESSGPVLNGAALLTRTPRPPTAQAYPVAAPTTPPERFLSRALREHIASRPTSEHRPVAVGFVQLRGTDALLARDQEAAVAAVDEIVLATQRAAAEYGVCLLGTDVDADGAKLILVAGAPVAGEHSEERLLRTCRAVLDVPTPLQLRSGATSGHVFVGDVGPSYRRAFTVMGERVNLAARLMASASPGELRTTPKVLAASATTFQVGQLEPLRLKGIADPVQAVTVGAAIGQDQPDRAELLIGRSELLDTLERALSQAKGGNGGVLELAGLPGVGKTALLNALLASADCPTLRVSASPYETETAFGLVRRLLRRLLGAATEATPAAVGVRMLKLLPDLPRSDLSLLLMASEAVPPPLDLPLPAVVEDDLLVTRLSRATIRALVALVPGPGLLVVEDLQWSDPSSTALLKELAGQMVDHPWLMCASHRPGSAATVPLLGHGSLVAVDPLSTEASTALVDVLTEDDPLPPRRLADLVARSGGNPLFLTELVRLSRNATELPESVEAVVNARVDALPAALRTTLRHAAVLGARFDLDLLAEISGSLPDDTQWSELEGLLRRDGRRGSFASEIYREVAYESLPFRLRRNLHSAAARALELRGSTDVELLALHAAQAEDDAMTWTYAVEAGRRSLARGAQDQAVLAFQRALHAHGRGALGDSADTQPVLVLLGDALVRAGRAQEALRVYRRARGLSPRGRHGDPELCHKEALARIELGAYASARDWLRRGLAACVGTQDAPARLALLESQAGVLFRQGRYTGALRTLGSLLRLTDGTEHRRSNAHAHDLTLLVMTTTGDARRAQHRTQAVAIYEQLDDVQGLAKAYNNLGTDAYYESRWDDAVALFEQSRQCEVQDANDVGAAISDSNIAEVLSDQGSFEEAHTRLIRALRTFRAVDFGLGVAEVLNHLGLLETRRGVHGRAAEHLAGAREIVESTKADSLLPNVTLREAALALSLGALDRADELLERVEQGGGLRTELKLTVEHLRAITESFRSLDDLAIARLRAVVSTQGDTHRYRTALARHSLSVLLDRVGDPEGPHQRTAALEALRALGVHQFRDPLAGSDLVVISLPPAAATATEVAV